MFDFLAKHRRLVLTFLAVGVWTAWCLPPLLQNQPEAFQASGSVIVIMAVLIYARERARRESEVVGAQRAQIVAILDDHETWGDYYSSQLRRKETETDLKFLQLRQAIEKGKVGKAALKKQATQLEYQLAESAKLHGQYFRKMELSHKASKKTYESTERTVRLLAPAAKAFERLELALVAFGTLQWGYGDHWVEYLHSIY